MSHLRAENISTRKRKKARKRRDTRTRRASLGADSVLGWGAHINGTTLAPCRPVLRVRCSLVFSHRDCPSFLLSFFFSFIPALSPRCLYTLSSRNARKTDRDLSHLDEIPSRWAPTCSSGFAGRGSCTPRKWLSKTRGLTSADVLGWYSP